MHCGSEPGGAVACAFFLAMTKGGGSVLQAERCVRTKTFACMGIFHMRSKPSGEPWRCRTSTPPATLVKTAAPVRGGARERSCAATERRRYQDADRLPGMRRAQPRQRNVLFGLRRPASRLCAQRPLRTRKNQELQCLATEPGHHAGPQRFGHPFRKKRDAQTHGPRFRAPRPRVGLRIAGSGARRAAARSALAGGPHSRGRHAALDHALGG